MWGGDEDNAASAGDAEGAARVDFAEEEVDENYGVLGGEAGRRWGERTREGPNDQVVHPVDHGVGVASEPSGGRGHDGRWAVGSWLPREPRGGVIQVGGDWGVQQREVVAGGSGVLW